MRVTDPIAIVGMACRLPGNANTPAAFWNVLASGTDAITEVPSGRWNAARFHHPTSGAPGRIVTRCGGFVEHPDAFDAAFFGIAPREAACMDPQHRWLLETAWEAIEDAGLPPTHLAGSRTGVFVGISQSDYPALHRRDASAIDRYTNIGSALSIAANRISYLFDLRGPSLAVDTACSSSLVALHLAARSVWSGESDYILVAAANALLAPEASIGFSQAHMLSPRGRCRAFDAGADGYVRSEGAAALLLMPEATAQALGLTARALLVATASNQDGHSSGLTVPNQQAQEAMLREALERAAANPRDVVYVEAHGTGTPVGDPIEARALSAVFSEGRQANDRILIGSVKTNIGHLEPASGLAGLIKAVLVLEHGMVPPNLHFETPNPRLPIERIHIPTELTPLPLPAGRAPLVAVNSFGFGGANAHALLAPAPALHRPDDEARTVEDPPCILPLSARNQAALADVARELADFIETPSERSPSLREICAVASLGKAHHPIRRALIAESLPDLQSQLRALSTAAIESPAFNAPPRIAFIFSGQGSQWWAMGRQLYRRERVVRDVWERCDAVCRGLGGPSVLDTLLADESASRLDRTDLAQPAIFALQASLVELWRAWGIEADVVLGHSVGEAAAAWAAGIYDLDAILRVVLARSRWQATTHGHGRMLAAGIGTDEARRWEQRFPGQVDLAAVNAPRQVTLAGDAAVLDRIASALAESQIFHRLLATSYAFHSAQMDPIAAGLRRELKGLTGCIGSTPMISTVTGEPIRGDELDADYWWRNVRQPVRFVDGVTRLLGDGCTVLLEVGPHPVMAAALTEIVLSQQSAAIQVASLRRGDDESRTMRQALAELYRHGANVRWNAVYTRPARAIRLPAYPWQRQHHWRESPDAARDLRRAPAHPLLGDRQPDPLPTWVGRCDMRLVSWLADHRLGGSAVVPAAAYLEMAAAAVREHLGEPIVFLEDIRFHHLLFLPDEQSVRTCVRLDPSAGSFQVLSARPDVPDTWQLQAEGLYRPGRLRAPAALDLASLRKQCNEMLDPQALYGDLAGIGQVYGPTFQALTSLQVRAEESVLSSIEASTDPRGSDYLLFPPALDSCFHSSFAVRRPQDRRAGIIMSVGQLRVFRPLPPKFWCHLRVVQHYEQSHVGDLTLCDDSGQVVAQIIGLVHREIDIDAKAGPRDRMLYRFVWEPSPLSAPAVHSSTESVVLFAGGHVFDGALIDRLREQSTTVVVDRARGRSADEHETGTISVDTRMPGWASAFWTTLAERGRVPTRILYLWGWDRDDNCGPFLALTKARLALPGGDDSARWLVITNRAQGVGDCDRLAPMRAGLWGFGRTVQTEQPQWHLSLMDADDVVPDDVIGELFAAEVEPEVSWRRGMRQVRRLRPFQPAESPAVGGPGPAYELRLGQPGRIDSLRFQGQARRAPEAGEVEIEVAAAGLNFRDVMKALGIYPLGPDEPVTFGDEFSGCIVRVGPGIRTVRAGDRVMGVAPAGGAIGSNLTLSARAVWKIPAHLGMAEAASIPVAFGTAYHALRNLARLRRGESVLIHAAAGGVGLAALQLARHIGAVVFATAGTEAKRELVRSMGAAHVMDSRTLDFAEQVLHETGGRGVDVVVNSLAGAFQQKSLEVCAPHARFVEIGKRDLFEHRALPTRAFQQSLSFFAFDLTSVLATPGPHARAIQRFLGRGFTKEGFEALPQTTFPAADAAAAFRWMQTAQHIGKIVLEFDPAQAPAVSAAFWPRPDATYLITGGLSGFGLATAGWLVDRGARHLALVSRRGAPSAEDAAALDTLRARGASLHLFAADVAEAEAVQDVLRTLRRSAPPLRGVFHSAMVLRDRFLVDMTEEDLAAVLAPKAAGAWNLHQQTGDLALDCFVMFSSISSVIGAPAQANYAAANAVLDALAHERRAEGLPALSVNWGQIGDVGVAAAEPAIARYLDAIGVQSLPSREALAALPHLMASGEAQVGAMDVDWAKLGRASTKFSTSPVFRELSKAVAPLGLHEASAARWREAVLALSAEDRIVAVTDMVLAHIAATLGTAASHVDPTGPLNGMDSLMAVELKVRIEDSSGCSLPIDIISADATVEQLAARVMKQMTATPDPVPVASARPGGSSGQFDVPFLSHGPIPLMDLVRTGELPPLTAAALMPWPMTLFERAGVSPDAFFQHMPRGVGLDVIIDTPLGPVGLFMLPLTTDQVTPGEASLMPLVVEGMRHASACGARCVALTGLIPSATQYGVAVRAACNGDGGAAPTTGHATTVAAVVLNLAELLRQAGRSIEDEALLFYGIGSIGLGALRLMLDVLPHPSELLLCDPFRDPVFFAHLGAELRGSYGYAGRVRVIGSGESRMTDFSKAGVIVGATNVRNVLDVSRLAPGTLIVDDSAPHCLDGTAAFGRLEASGDIVFTEGGFVRAGTPMRRTAHVPRSIASMIPAEVPRLMFSMFDPQTITGCVLSALISAGRVDLPPTVGPVTPEAARQHWAALHELGFRAADPNYEGRGLPPETVVAFRGRFGRSGLTRASSPAVS